ncbi:MAG: HAMP domain-containing histidine kinase [Firmicutes bacterium]|nr:HAMP domain-containing histidine kinase [Bacillota bacterium]
MTKRKEQKKPKSRLWLYFSLVVYITVFAVTSIMLMAWRILFATDMVETDPFNLRNFILLPMLGMSFIVGSAVAFFVGHLIIRPLKIISEGFDELSDGNFDVRMPTNFVIEDIGETARQFNKMAESLGKIEALSSDFVDNVSHEFKTPIASIEGYATLLQNENTTPERRAYYVERIIANSRQLSDLSSNVLMLSKLENRSTLPPAEDFSLDEELRQTVLLLEDMWSAKNIEFDIDIPSVTFHGNRQFLERVWYNLIHNAIKHSSMGGTITIGLEANEREVAVTVKDSGDGMTPEVQSHIFEKFYQGDSSHKAEGNGLGLSLVKRIVTIYGGDISVVSEPGKGSEFTVTLPRQVASAD